MKTRHFIFSALFMILLVAGCTKNSAPMEPGTDYADFVSGGEKAYGDAGGGESPGDPGEHTGAQAGKVTAGEWRDLDNWMFWSDLMQNKVYEEVTVNFCTDTACTPEETDETGMIAFEGEPREYHVQIVDVPEGYSYDESFDMYTTLAQNADRKKTL